MLVYEPDGPKGAPAGVGARHYESSLDGLTDAPHAWFPACSPPIDFRGSMLRVERAAGRLRDGLSDERVSLTCRPLLTRRACQANYEFGGGGFPIPTAANKTSVEHLTTLRRKLIVITGKCWRERSDLAQSIESAGGLVGSDVTRSTDVLVRGESQRWTYGDFGLKEAAAAKQIRNGRPLHVIHDYEFRKVLEERKPGRCADYVAGQPIAWLLPPPRTEQFERVARITGPLDREQTVLGRTEQGFLRTQLFQGREQDRCALCGRGLPVELLVAAHIKPRSECTTKERRDAACISFAACLLGCDALYEKGFMSVGENGQVVTASLKGLPAQLREQLGALRNRRCSAWHEGTAGYFAWHCLWRFRG